MKASINRKRTKQVKRTLIESLQVGLAWDSKIKEWAERKLPNGEVVGRVKNAQTVNYKTLKPVKDGLFCEKIFGPVKDFECSCGIKQSRGGFCAQCNVEFTRSEVRRYRLGYFQLPSAVTHIWYLRGRPYYISNLLGIKSKKALSITYGAASLLVNIPEKKGIDEGGDVGIDSVLDKAIKREDLLPFSFLSRTLYGIGECKGKALPRNQIRRYNPNHFLFDRERGKEIKNSFHKLLYSSHTNDRQSNRPYFVGLKGHEKDWSPETETTSLEVKTRSYVGTPTQHNLSTYLDSLFSYKRPASFSLHINKPFFFSSAVRGSWQPLIAINLDRRLPVSLLHKRVDPRYCQFKEYLHFSRDVGLYKGFQNKKLSLRFAKKGKQKAQQGGWFKIKNFAKSATRSSLSTRRIISSTSRFACFSEPPYFALQSAFPSLTDREQIVTKKKHVPAALKAKEQAFFKKIASLNKRIRVRRSLVGFHEKKGATLSALIFYPIRKAIAYLQKEEGLARTPSFLSKQLYRELDSVLRSLGLPENENKERGFSSQDKFERIPILLPFSEKNIETGVDSMERFSKGDATTQSKQTGLTLSKDNFSHSNHSGRTDGNLTTLDQKDVESPSSAKEEEEEEQERGLVDFRNLFHFIGQPCRLRKRSRFLVHTASSFSQTRNQIFQILKRERLTDSVHFGDKLSSPSFQLKERSRPLRRGIKKEYKHSHLLPSRKGTKKEYKDSHLLPYLFSLSCKPDSCHNYQHNDLQAYPSVFAPPFPNSKRTLLISFYQKQAVERTFLNLYDTFIKNTFTSSTPFSDSSRMSLKEVTSAFSLEEYLAEDQAVDSKNSSSLERGETFQLHNKDQGTFPVNGTKDVPLFLGRQGTYAEHECAEQEVDKNFGEIPLVLDQVSFNKMGTLFAPQKEGPHVKTLYQRDRISIEADFSPGIISVKGRKSTFGIFCKQNKRDGKGLSRGESGKTKAFSKGISFCKQNVERSALIKKDEQNVAKALLRLNRAFLFCLQGVNGDLTTSNNGTSSLEKRGRYLFCKQNEIERRLFLLLQNRNKDLFLRFSKNLHFAGSSFSVRLLPPLYKMYTWRTTCLLPSASFDKVKGLTFCLQNVFRATPKKLKETKLFEGFASQNLSPGWRVQKQIKKILKTVDILNNKERGAKPPIPSAEWSLLLQRANRGGDFLPIYEISEEEALHYTCGEGILKLLSPINCSQLESGLNLLLEQIHQGISEVKDLGFLLKSDIRLLKRLQTRKLKALRRLKIAKILRKTKVLPKQMVLSILPVLPPSLRPIIQLDENAVVVSDCSQIYQKIVQRSNRLSKRLGKFVSYEHCLRLKVLLQQAVDGLIENGKGGSTPLCDNNGRPLKSLSDGLKGKKGRFRQDLLGRRVDYSGRSVIVVGPALKLHQCGLPKGMAIELFQPFLIRQLFSKNIVKNIAIAKSEIQKETPIVLKILKQLLRSHPVLLNRAPTLHRLGVQAFQPKLVSGRAILLHPLVCSAFNADFDGDQMAVHIPLSSKARTEAWKMLWSRNNILSPATGQPILVPSQDMVLGSYYLTTKKENLLSGKLVNNYQVVPFSGKFCVDFVKERQQNMKDQEGLDEMKNRRDYQDQKTTVKPFNTEAGISDKREINNRHFARFNSQILQSKVSLRALILQNRINKGDIFVEEEGGGWGGVNRTPFDKVKNLSLSQTEEETTKLQTLQKKTFLSSSDKIGSLEKRWAGRFYTSSYQVLQDLKEKRLKLHTSIWLKIDCDIEVEKEEQKPLEARINRYGNFTKVYPGYLRRLCEREGSFFEENQVKKLENFYVRTTCGRVMLNQTISPILPQPF